MFKKIKPSHFLSYLVLPLWLAISTHAFAGDTRIAVIGDPSLGELVDATTAQLSTLPGLSVLERSDLDKLGREKALQDIVGSNDLSSVQFVPADGLLILRAVKQDGKTGVFVRLVAVQPGIVLREMALSDGPDLLAHANEIAKEFAPFWPKLAQIQKGKINALSLLGLRFEVDAPDTHEMERKINVLLASRLSTEPDTVVLERWRLNDAVFEKSLGAQQPAPFWTGSSLIDGSMKWENKQVEVSLRVRPPNGAEVSISDKDSADNLPALVARLADKIQTHPITQGAWQPAAEADHFAALGKWCLDNHLYDEGAEAIESAIALGDNSQATQLLQIRAYRLLTFADEQPEVIYRNDPRVDDVDPASIPSRVKSGTTAADLSAAYLEAHLDFSGQPGAADDPVDVSLPVLDNCLRLLRTAYQKGFAYAHEDETTAMRHAVKNLISQLEPLLAKRPPDQRKRFLTYQVRYAPYWHETPEATVAYYRDLLNRPTDGAIIRKELFDAQYFSMRPPCFLPEAEQQAANPDDTFVLGDWYVSSPRILSWENRPLTELQPIWDNFVKELGASSDPVEQADALKFEFSVGYQWQNTYAWVSQDKNGVRLADFLEQNRDSICGPRGNDLLTGFYWTVSVINGQALDKGPQDRLRLLGDTLLKKRQIVPLEWIRWMPQIYYQAPTETAVSVLADLDAYRQWYQTQTPQDAEMVTALDQARRPLVVYAGAAPKGKEDFLAVNQHWPIQPDEEHSLDDLRALPFPPSLITAENKAWFIMSGGKQVLSVDLTTLQTVASFTFPDQMIQDRNNSPGGGCLGVTPQYLVAAVFGHVMLCSRADNSWRKLDLPPSNYKPCWVNQQLYLLYDVESDQMGYQNKGNGAATAVSGLIHVSLPDGGIDNLVSTRRIPPQSPLDGKPLGYPLDLWTDSGGLRLAADADSPHFQVFGASAGKNDWASIATDPMWCDVKTAARGELIGKGFDDYGFAQIELLTGATREVLLSNPLRVPPNGNSSARWEIPDEIKTTPTDVRWQASTAMRGDDLCLYRNAMRSVNDGFETSLYYFAKGQKRGLKIPLKFQTNVQNSTLVKAESIIVDFQSLQATDYGLVIVQERGGFWVIPWKDIDAYRAHAGPAVIAASQGPDDETSAATVPALPAMPAPAPAPPILPTPAAVIPPAPVTVIPPAPAVVKPPTPVVVIPPAPVVVKPLAPVRAPSPPPPAPAANLDDRD